MRAQLSRERSEIIKQTANHIISREDTSEHSENLKAVAELALLALGGMDSEPVAYNQVQRDTMKDIIVRKLGGNLRGDKLVMADIHAVTMALIQAGFRTAPPAPVAVPDEMYWQDAPVEGSTRAAAYATGWNACRAAMLKSGPVTAATVPLDYVQGEYDGREWAAQLAEANHPQTGDWIYDDPIELAKAIRKGPDMPSMAAPEQEV